MKIVIPEHRDPSLLRPGDIIGDLRKREMTNGRGVWTRTLISRYEGSRPRSPFAPLGHPDRERIPDPSWHAIYGPGEGRVAGCPTGIPIRLLERPRLVWCGNIDMMPFKMELPPLRPKVVDG